MPLIDGENLRAVLWAVLVGVLVVIVSGVLVGWGVAPWVVVLVALFALPVTASLPFVPRIRPAKGR